MSEEIEKRTKEIALYLTGVSAEIEKLSKKAKILVIQDMLENISTQILSSSNQLVDISTLINHLKEIPRFKSL